MAKNRPRVYIDSCYFIDVVKGRLSKSLDEGRDTHLPYVEGLLLAAENGDIEVWTSTLTLAECLTVTPDADAVPPEVQAQFIEMLEAGHPVKLQAPDVFVTEKARALRWEDGMRCGGSADCVHVATAIILSCQELLSTNRRRGPLNEKCAPKLLSKYGLAAIKAPSTMLLPAQYFHPLLAGSSDLGEA